MKKIVFLLIIFICRINYAQVDVSIGYNSTGLTTAELAAIPAALKTTGLIIKDKDLDILVTWDGAQFVPLSAGGSDGLGAARDVGPFTVVDADNATMNAGAITSTHILNNTIQSVDILDGTIVENDIQAGAVGTTAIGSGAIVEDDLFITNTPTNTWLLSSNTAGGNFTWVNPATLGFLSNIVEDLTPQLGADLDAQDNGIDNLDFWIITNTGNANQLTATFDGTNRWLQFGPNGSSPKVLRYDFTNEEWEYDGAELLTTASGLTDIVDDTSPQLGATLDAQSFSITGVGALTGGSFNFNGLGRISLGNYWVDDGVNEGTERMDAFVLSDFFAFAPIGSGKRLEYKFSTDQWLYDGTELNTGGSANIEDDAFGPGWDTDTTNGASQNALYDYIIGLTKNTISGRTGTAVDGIMIQTKAQIATDGDPDTDEIVFCSNCAPMELDDNTTVTADGYIGFDDRTSDTATYTFSGLTEGSVVVIEMDRASAPALSGITPSNSGWADDFAANTEQTFTLVVLPSGRGFIKLQTIE